MKSGYSNRSIGAYEKRGAHCYSVSIINEDGNEHDKIFVNIPSGMEPEEGIKAVTGLELKESEPEPVKDVEEADE